MMSSKLAKITLKKTRILRREPIIECAWSRGSTNPETLEQEAPEKCKEKMRQRGIYKCPINMECFVAFSPDAQKPLAEGEGKEG